MSCLQYKVLPKEITGTLSEQTTPDQLPTESNYRVKYLTMKLCNVLYNIESHRGNKVSSNIIIEPPVIMSPYFCLGGWSHGCDRQVIAGILTFPWFVNPCRQQLSYVRAKVSMVLKVPQCATETAKTPKSCILHTNHWVNSCPIHQTLNSRLSNIIKKTVCL